jgi:hypothetical protein
VRAVKADALLASFGGSRGYLDAEAFAQHPDQPHQFTHPTYKRWGGATHSGLAGVDLLARAH